MARLLSGVWALALLALGGCGEAAAPVGIDSGPPDELPPFMCPATCAPCQEHSCDGRTGEGCLCSGRDRPCPCHLRCSASARCEASCRRVPDECVVDAPGAAELAVVCDASDDCRVDARGVLAARVDCQRAGDCTVDCRGARACVVQCRGAARCLLRCDGAGCGMQRSDCEPVDCGDGVWACNRACP